MLNSYIYCLGKYWKLCFVYNFPNFVEFFKFLCVAWDCLNFAGAKHVLAEPGGDSTVQPGWRRRRPSL
jgi:hypothetical protein